MVSIAGPCVPGSWIIKGADKAHDGINTVKKLKLVEKVSSYFDEAVEYSVKIIKKSVTAVGPHVGKIKKGADIAIRLPYAAFKVVDNKIDDALIKSGRYLSGKVDEAARYIKSVFCHGEDVTEAVTKKADEIAEAVQKDSGMLDNILEEAVDDKPDIPNNGGGSPDSAPDPGNGTAGDNSPDGNNGNKPKGEAGTDVIKQLDDVLSDKTLTNQTKKVDNYVSSMKGNTAAKADFDAMNPTNIRTYSNGTIAGDLPDGRTINIHPSTTLNGTPSVEVYDPATGKSIKIRY